jgi:hypothetical protein
MDETRALRHAAWAGVAAVVLLGTGVTFTALAGVDAPGVADAAILDRVTSGAKQAAAGVGLPLMAAGTAFLMWFATGLRQVLDRLSPGDPLTQVIVPAAALFGGLAVVGAGIDISSAITALATDEFTPDPDLSRALGTAGALVGLTGLVGGGVIVAATTRIVQQAHAVPRWAVWVSYGIAALCLVGFWTAGMASLAFGVWVVGAVVALLRTAGRPPAERRLS